MSPTHYYFYALSHLLTPCDLGALNGGDLGIRIRGYLNPTAHILQNDVFTSCLVSVIKNNFFKVCLLQPQTNIVGIANDEIVAIELQYFVNRPGKRLVQRSVLWKSSNLVTKRLCERVSQHTGSG